MNSVLNKDFAPKSYQNSSLIAFSDVFRPASGMQINHVNDVGRIPVSPSDHSMTLHYHAPAKESLMGRSNAC